MIGSGSWARRYAWRPVRVDGALARGRWTEYAVDRWD